MVNRKRKFRRAKQSIFVKRFTTQPVERDVIRAEQRKAVLAFRKEKLRLRIQREKTAPARREELRRRQAIQLRRSATRLSESAGKGIKALLLGRPVRRRRRIR